VLFKKEERRRYKRIPAHFLIKFSIPGENEDLVLSFIRNISAGGVLFFSEKKINPGTLIKMTINVPSATGEPINVRSISRTIYAAKLRGLDGYNIGAEFAEIDPQDREALLTKLEGKSL
jgi:c-di-GMP-binding flagellar brake protein YcgR